MKTGFVYIMTNVHNTTFYTGVTSDLETRVLEHKNGNGSIHTGKYNCIKLVYFEEIAEVDSAIEREKQLKNWHRQWKINLIKAENPEFKDLSEDWYKDKIFISD